MSKLIKPNIRPVAVLLVVLLAATAVLWGWWGYLLKTRLGDNLKLQRMLFWESFAMIGFLFGIAAILAWLYLRDTKRTRALQAFFGSVAHELRNPLASIVLQAEALSMIRGGAGADTAAKLLQDADRLRNELDRMLELARVEGSAPIYVKDIKLKPFLQEFIENWQSERAGKITLRSALHDVTVCADEQALKVILRNLLENTLSHAQRDVPVVSISCQSHGKYMILNYSDDGVGIDATVPRPGSLFSKGHLSKGTGIGLYLIKKLAKKMGGKAEFSTSGGFRASLVFKRGSVNA